MIPIWCNKIVKIFVRTLYERSKLFKQAKSLGASSTQLRCCFTPECCACACKRAWQRDSVSLTVGLHGRAFVHYHLGQLSDARFFQLLSTNEAITHVGRLTNISSFCSICSTKTDLEGFKFCEARVWTVINGRWQDTHIARGITRNLRWSRGQHYCGTTAGSSACASATDPWILYTASEIAMIVSSMASNAIFRPSDASACAINFKKTGMMGQCCGNPREDV